MRLSSSISLLHKRRWSPHLLHKRRLLRCCALCNSLGHQAFQCPFCLQKLHSSKLTCASGLVRLFKNGLLGTTRTDRLDITKGSFPTWVLRRVCSTRSSLTTISTEGWEWRCRIFPRSLSKSSRRAIKNWTRHCPSRRARYLTLLWRDAGTLWVPTNPKDQTS